MSDQVETMAYAGEVPWHGLGKRVLPDLTPDQMMHESGTDWEVKLVTFRGTIRVGDTTYTITDPKRKMLVRVKDGVPDKHPFTVTGCNWNPVQNADAFAFFHEYVMEGGMEMHTAGSLRQGQVVWALAKIKESFELFGGDRVDSYLLFSNPHEYGKSINVRFTPIRVVCNNTLCAALGTQSVNSAAVSHRSAFDPKAVKEMLGLAHKKLGQYKEAAEFLGSKRYSKETLVQYFSGLYPAKKGSQKAASGELTSAAEVSLGAVKTQPGSQFAEGTWWQAFNAATYAMDHLLGKSADVRMDKAWFGSNVTRKVRALNSAVELAKAA